MTNRKIDETLPVDLTPDGRVSPEAPQPGEAPQIEEMVVPGQPIPRRKGCLRSWALWLVMALLLLCVIAGLSGGGGYLAGNRDRKDAQKAEVRKVAQTQFAMAMLDIDAGRFRLLPTRMASFQEWPAGQRDISPEVALELQV